MQPTARSSPELLAALADSRDGAAWAELVARHGAAMRRSAMAVTSDADAADDAVQEALLHLRQRAGRFREVPPGVDPEDAVRHWLQRMSANAALHLLRSERRRQGRERQVPVEAAAEEAPMQQSCEPVQLSAALGRLSDGDRRVVLLRHVEGLDGPALAAALGCEAGAARVRLHRAMERLRGHLARAGVAITATALAARLDAATAAWSQTPSAATTAAWQNVLASTSSPRLSFHLLTGAVSPMAIIAASSIPVIAACLALAVHLNGAEPSRAPTPQPPAAPTVAAPTPAPPVDARRATPALPTPDAPVPAKLDPAMQTAITLKVVDMELRQVVGFLARLSEADLSIAEADEPVAGRMLVTLDVQDMPLVEVLQTIKRATGLSLRIEAKQGVFSKAP